MSFRDDVLAALDVRRFYEGEVALGGVVGPNEYRFSCPFHDDREASANVNLVSGLWHCHACNVGGGPIDWLMRREGVDTKAALEKLAGIAGVERQSARAAAPARSSRRMLSDDNVTAWHEAALRNAELMRWFAEKRGFTPETVARWQLGWDGERVTIPVRDEGGKLVNVRRYQRNSSSVAGKMLSITPGAGEARLWPLPLPDVDVLLVEGEWDMILLRQHGFANAVTVTSGAGIFKAEWVELFRGRLVTICYDNDEAGRRGAQKVARMLAATTNVFILQIPGLPDKGDPTDFFVEQSRSGDELRALIADATPYVMAQGMLDDEREPTPVTLAEAASARHQGERLAIPVLVSGKAMTPYTIPAEWTTHCDLSNKRLCGICPLQEVAGVREVKIAASDPAVLSLVNVTDEGRERAMKAIAEAVAACNRPQHDVKRWVNVEELRLIPDVDTNEAGETEYVARQGFLIGHGVAANRGYEVRGYTHPHPKTQATVHLLAEAIPAQDNISAFALTPELRDRLAVFRAEGDVEARFRAIYDDMAATVHRIRDRFDMQIAYDLVWHSLISFSFNGALVRRGWVEAMVMSDSGQGKTEMALSLLRHYRLGHRVQAEQSSSAGLIGGLEKMGDTWLLGWGQIPLNDKRLLVIDESQGLAAAAIEGLSDVRATGIAEITKIRTERTNARCRILWLANPVSGLTLSQHNQGVLAIKDLFKKPEDVRRLDFAICLASGDVDYAKAINVTHGAAREPTYSTELCRALVLWAWSRRSDQVTFTAEATDAILDAATDMGRRYHASIPLVEPSDQRLKLARLAAAAAARVYSTDDAGEQVIVDRRHVDFVTAYLDRIYNARAMSYGEYSGQQRRGESLDDDEETEISTGIRQWEKSEAAVDFFRQARVFKKAELEDVVGWDDAYIKAQLRWLAGKRLIATTRDGYKKTPAFIALLRRLGTSASIVADVKAVLEEAEF